MQRRGIKPPLQPVDTRNSPAFLPPKCAKKHQLSTLLGTCGPASKALIPQLRETLAACELRIISFVFCEKLANAGVLLNNDDARDRT